ncbi:Maf-like protein, partial [Tuber borchii]
PPPLDLPALNMIRGKRVILASASPRRKQLLSQIGLTDIEVIPSSFAENLDKSRYEAFEYVLETAIQKCLEVYKREINNQVKGEPAIVLSADTVIVSYTGEIMEKPRSEEGHLAMLKALRDGPPHKVCTAVVAMAPLETLVHPGYAQENHVEETIVTFDPMVTDDLLEAYVKTREGADKAGGYAIQGAGSILVKKIEGTFDNVVGLPLRGTLKVIERVLSNDEMVEEGDE